MKGHMLADTTAVFRAHRPGVRGGGPSQAYGIGPAQALPVIARSSARNVRGRQGNYAGRAFSTCSSAPLGRFQWTPNAQAKEIIGAIPEGRQVSAVIPLLDLAQRQVGAETKTQGWLPIPVMEFVARELDTSYIRVLEVATFYTMFNLAPVGRFHVQVCGTTPCMLRGSDDLFDACEKRGLKKGHTTEDGLFTLTEVECLGACANAPMVQINDDNYEDLTEESMAAILDALASGKTPEAWAAGRPPDQLPAGGPTTLKKMAERNYDYRPQWTATAGRRRARSDRPDHRRDHRHPARRAAQDIKIAIILALRRHRHVRAEQAWAEADQMTSSPSSSRGAAFVDFRSSGDDQDRLLTVMLGRVLRLSGAF